MKILKLNFYRGLTMNVLMCIMVLSFFSCSKEDDQPELYGRWFREYTINSYETATEEYDFWKNGEGDYVNSAGVMGTFTYNISSPSTVNIKMKYWNVYHTWHQDYTWSYHVDGDYLKLNGKMYIRYH